MVHVKDLVPLGILLFMQLATTLAITTCPVTETSITTTNGLPARICPGTDYQGPSAQIIGSVASINACTQLCANDSKCVKAVYDTSNSNCHFKSTTDALTWVANTRFNSVQIDIVTPRTVIAKCPYVESSYTAKNGAKFQVCADTDYVGGSLQVVQNIASTTDCSNLCSTTSGCTKAVYDNVYSVCHIKDDSGNLIWSTNRQFTTVRINADTSKLPATMGKWSNIIKLPVIPVAGYVVPQQPAASRLLFFSSFGVNDFGGANGYTQFADYNYQTGQVSQRQVSNTQHDMFCPGISALTDGRIVITGGSNAEVTSIYDPVSNTFTRGPDMKIARGYQSSVTLSNGKIFTIGGSYSGGIGGKSGEIYDPSANTWTSLPQADVTPMLTTYDAEGAWRTDNHGWLYGWRNGAVFQAGPSKTMHWYGTTGSGSVSNAGTRDADNDAMCGVNAMYDAVAGKIFAAGGTQSYTNSPALARAFITTIGNPNTAATVERMPDMTFARAFANAIVLPDGTTLVTGGQTTARVFTDIEAILVPELFNPVSKKFTKLASAAVPRNYHSLSLLLPDGTVFNGGGGLCYTGGPANSDANCDRSVDHSDGQIFSPPYLYSANGQLATRPVISSLSSSTSSNGYQVRVGGKLTIKMDSSVSTKFALIRMGSATHSVNTDQRRVPLNTVTANGASFVATLPSDSGVLIPGFYYLFAMSSSGVPSIAKTVQITL